MRETLAAAGLPLVGAPLYGEWGQRWGRHGARMLLTAHPEIDAIFAAECRPPLTTVDLNLQQLGATAVKHLFATIDGGQTSGVIRYPGRLVVRESTGPRPPG